MSCRISFRIEQICQSLGIDYHSPYLEKINFHDDAIKLGELYYQLKQIVAEIVEIADKHGAEDLVRILWDDIRMIENVDHDLVKLAKLMSQEGYDGKQK